MKPLCATVCSSGPRADERGGDHHRRLALAAGAQDQAPRALAQRERAGHRADRRRGQRRGEAAGLAADRDSVLLHAVAEPEDERRVARDGEAARRCSRAPSASQRADSTTARGVRSTSAASPWRVRVSASSVPSRRATAPASRSGMTTGTRRPPPSAAESSHTTPSSRSGRISSSGGGPALASSSSDTCDGEPARPLGGQRHPPRHGVRAALRLQLGLLRRVRPDRARQRGRAVARLSHAVHRGPGAAQLQVDAVGLRGHGAGERALARGQLHGADRAVEHEAHAPAPDAAGAQRHVELPDRVLVARLAGELLRVEPGLEARPREVGERLAGAGGRVGPVHATSWRA